MKDQNISSYTRATCYSGHSVVCSHSISAGNSFTQPNVAKAGRRRARWRAR